MTDIEAQGSIRELLENACEFLHCTTRRLALVHVLDARARPQFAPEVEAVNSVRVDHHRPLSPFFRFQSSPQRGFRSEIELTGSVDGNMTELGQIQVIEGLEQREKFV